MQPTKANRQPSTDPSDSPYEFRDERRVRDPSTLDREERDVVIVDGQAMSFRAYRR